MAVLTGGGVSIDVPAGWDGRIRRVADPGDDALTAAHVASFRLPDAVGDFGSGAVETMGFNDILLVLLEYTDESLGTPLFQREGVPRALRAGEFDPAMLQRTLAGQSGAQRFFTVAGRPFCLYVALGSHRNRSRAVQAINDILATVQITAA
jgi:hypothetical protein